MFYVYRFEWRVPLDLSVHRPVETKSTLESKARATTQVRGALCSERVSVCDGHGIALSIVARCSSE